MQLFAFDTAKKFLTPKADESPKTPFPPSLIAGALAGVSSTLCTYPLELIKTRLTIEVNKTPLTYTSAFLCVHPPNPTFFCRKMSITTSSMLSSRYYERKAPQSSTVGWHRVWSAWCHTLQPITMPTTPWRSSTGRHSSRRRSATSRLFSSVQPRVPSRAPPPSLSR